MLSGEGSGPAAGMECPAFGNRLLLWEGPEKHPGILEIPAFYCLMSELTALRHRPS